MKVKNLLVSGCVCATMAAFPAMAATSQARACPVGKVTPASYTWDFQKETDGILHDVQVDAEQAFTHADHLLGYVQNQNFRWELQDFSWNSNAIELTQLKDLINDMGQKMCRLETIRRVDTPWQQNTIDRIATTLRLMADNSTDAIVFGSHNEHELWLATYKKYVNNLFDEAGSLRRSVDHAVKYAKVQRQEQILRKDLGIKASS